MNGVALVAQLVEYLPREWCVVAQISPEHFNFISIKKYSDLLHFLALIRSNSSGVIDRGSCELCVVISVLLITSVHWKCLLFLSFALWSG